jgi:hypothetical protein
MKLLSKIRPHWRKMTWVLITFTVIMFAWMIGGGTSAGSQCNDVSGHYQNAKEAGCQAGTAIGVGLIFGLWFFGFVVLSIIWFMTRPKGRDCPVCGEKVKKRRTTCRSCGFDFAAAAGQQPVSTGQVSAVSSMAAPPPVQQAPAGERHWDGTQWTVQVRGGTE